jgi:acetyl-CoA decarbonylase/synthase complex subunit delta
MGVDLLVEKWSGSINEVRIGATAEEGGSRKKSVIVGGQKGLPFLFQESQIPHRPAIAMEVYDIAPVDWPEVLTSPFTEVLDSPVDWAAKCVNEFNADLICLKLAGAHPDSKDRSANDEAKLVKEILKVIDVPLIILGCRNAEKDNVVLPACSQAAKGEVCLIGSALQENYKTLVASCLADGHNIIAESPIDINIAKQLNILITDMGISADRIVIDPTIGALGYGLEYGYSIMERARLAALSGDKMLAMPFLCLVGQESWRAKEAKALSREFPEWGPEDKRGPAWETVTALAVLQAGADIVIMRHPKAVHETREMIENLFANPD